MIITNLISHYIIVNQSFSIHVNPMHFTRFIWKINAIHNKLKMFEKILIKN